MLKQITNEDYITITRDGVFVGGKPARMYHGKYISKLETVKHMFFSPGTADLLEIRVMQSDTYGIPFKSGKPEPSVFGNYVWMQVVSKYGVSPWIFRLRSDAKNDVAETCAFNAAWTIEQHKNWRDCLLDASKNGQEEAVKEKTLNTVSQPQNITMSLQYTEDVQRICATLKPMGKFNVYSNDAKTVRLSFKPHKIFATEQSTDFVVDCLRKMGFSDINNDKTKEDFFHSVHGHIVCEYDLNTGKIQNANRQDIMALYNMIEFMRVWCTFFMPGKTEDSRTELPYFEYKSALKNYLHDHQNIKQ